MVALPPPHITPCATRLSTVSARKPIPLPRSFEQSGMIPKKMPIPSPYDNKTSAVFKNDDTTSALKGFNHLPQVKGEKANGPVTFPSLQATTRFSYAQWINSFGIFLVSFEKPNFSTFWILWQLFGKYLKKFLQNSFGNFLTVFHFLINSIFNYIILSFW